MYVCLCRAVTERSVMDAISAGATSVSAVGRACGAGRTCGGCRPEIRRLLRQERPGWELDAEVLAFETGAGPSSTPGADIRHIS